MPTPRCLLNRGRRGPPGGRRSRMLGLLPIEPRRGRGEGALALRRLNMRPGELAGDRDSYSLIALCGIKTELVEQSSEIAPRLQIDLSRFPVADANEASADERRHRARPDVDRAPCRLVWTDEKNGIDRAVAQLGGDSTDSRLDTVSSHDFCASGGEYLSQLGQCS